MHLPPYATMQGAFGLGTERQDARSPSDDAREQALTPASRVESAPAGTPPGALFDLGRTVLRAAPFVLLLALAGCDPGPAQRAAERPAEGGSRLTKLIGDVASVPDVVYRFHDDESAVTCWMTTSGGVFCLPDSQIWRDR